MTTASLAQRQNIFMVPSASSGASKFDSPKGYGTWGLTKKPAQMAILSPLAYICKQVFLVRFGMAMGKKNVLVSSYVRDSWNHAKAMWTDSIRFAKEKTETWKGKFFEAMAKDKTKIN